MDSAVILVGQSVIDVKGQEGLIACAGDALHQELQLPRLRRIERELGRGNEQADFLELGPEEELGHVATLRKERRRAYHREHDPRSGERPSGEAQSRVDAPRLELRLAAQLADIERRLAGPAALRAKELLDQTMSMAAEAGHVGSFPGALEQRDAQAIAEALADAYLEGAENSNDETCVKALQDMAAKAIARLAWLRSLVAG